MKQSYWNQTGKHQAEFNRLCDLMPIEGKSATVAGELIRAANRLAYDCWNNGMGNNTSGAGNFLHQKGAIDSSLYERIHYWTRGRILQGTRLDNEMNLMIDKTVEYILAHPELETAHNDDDIFDYQEEEQWFCENCGDAQDQSDGCFDGNCENCYELSGDYWDDED